MSESKWDLVCRKREKHIVPTRTNLDTTVNVANNSRTFSFGSAFYCSTLAKYHHISLPLPYPPTKSFQLWRKKQSLEQKQALDEQLLFPDSQTETFTKTLKRWLL